MATSQLLEEIKNDSIERGLLFKPQLYEIKSFNDHILNLVRAIIGLALRSGF